MKVKMTLEVEERELSAIDWKLVEWLNQTKNAIKHLKETGSNQWMLKGLEETERNLTDLLDQFQSEMRKFYESRNKSK